MNANLLRTDCLTSPAMDSTLGGDLEAWTRIEGDTVILVLRGEIRRDNSRKLLHKIFGLIGIHSPRRLIVDLEQISFMDSAGCAVLIEALGRMRACNGEVRLLALQPPVNGLLEIAGIGSMFAIARK